MIPSSFHQFSYLPRRELLPEVQEGEVRKATTSEVAEILHEVFCQRTHLGPSYDCDWTHEEGELVNEWAGKEHRAWLRAASAVQEQPWELSDLLRARSEVLRLAATKN